MASQNESGICLVNEVGTSDVKWKILYVIDIYRKYN